MLKIKVLKGLFILAFGDLIFDIDFERMFSGRTAARPRFSSIPIPFRSIWTSWSWTTRAALYHYRRTGSVFFETLENSEALVIPEDFFTDSFNFMERIESWLEESGYEDCRNLSMSLSMTAGDLNNLENLGLVQKIPKSDCGMVISYKLSDRDISLKPQEDNNFPLGSYSFTTEGKKLFDVIYTAGNEAVLTIVTKYFTEQDIKFAVLR